MNPYSCGTSSAPGRNMTLSLPSCWSANWAPRIDPSASPSGFSCVTSRKRSCERIASATAAALPSLVAWCELIDQPRHANSPFYRRIVFERQLWGSLQPELAADPALEHAVRGRQPGERLRALALVAEHADVDARLPQVGRGVDPRDRDEPDPRVLELGKRVGEHALDRFVDAAHAVTHRALPPRVPHARARIPARSGTAPRRRAAPPPRGSRGRRTRRRAARAARGRGGRPRRPTRRSGSGAGPSPTSRTSACP